MEQPIDEETTIDPKAIMVELIFDANNSGEFFAVTAGVRKLPAAPRFGHV